MSAQTGTKQAPAKAAVLSQVATIGDKRVTVEQFLLRAIPYVAAEYNTRLARQQASGLKKDRQPTKGAHARQLNALLRTAFPKVNPMEVTAAAIEAGIVASRPAMGGPMFYLASDAEGWGSESKAVAEILATL